MKSLVSLFLSGLALAGVVAAVTAQTVPAGAGGGGRAGANAFGGAAGLPGAGRTKPFPETATAPAGEFKGTPVTLKVEGVPLRNALDQLRDKTGLQFTFQAKYAALEQKVVTLDVRDKPLWETLRVLLTQADPTPALVCGVREPDSRGSQLINGHFSVSGPFLVLISRITHQVSATPGQAERYNVMVTVLGDPSIRLSGVQNQSTATRATDERGDSLVSTLPMPRTFVPRTGGSLGGVTIVLEPPAKGDLPKKIAVLEGVLPATFLETDTVEVAMGQKIEKKYGPYTATVSLGAGRSVAGRAAPVAEVSLKYAVGDSVSDALLTDLQQQVPALQMELLDTEGKPLPLEMGSWGNSRREITVQESFPPQAISGPGPQPVVPAGVPGKVVVHLPTGFKVVEIPYRFEDVALP